jgi:tRNA 2-selenouridine synthase
MDDVERAIVGTAYKRHGKQNAILRGLDIAGPKLRGYIQQAKRIAKDNTLIVHCWRGGMRSGFLSWLLEFYGFKVFVLKGGYKSFRKCMLDEISKERNIQVLGGPTGSGKTEILHAIRSQGNQVLDLEGLAHHKGSSFGALGETAPPSQEMFENEIGLELIQSDAQKILWVEDESRLIGNKVIPQALWDQMRSAKVWYLDIPFEVRLDYIVKMYGVFPVEALMDATQRIEKRIGPQQTKEALQALRDGDLRKGLFYSLVYYDKAYRHKTDQRTKESVFLVSSDVVDAERNAQLILSAQNKI